MDVLLRVRTAINCPLSGEITALVRQDTGCERLVSVPGVGPSISGAIVAAIATGEAFLQGRDFAAWLGLVSKQISTGDRTILGKMSKRGNRYLLGSPFSASGATLRWCQAVPLCCTIT
jgi:transposase